MDAFCTQVFVAGRKLPNLVGHRGADLEPAQNVQLVVVHCETTRQSNSIGVTGPVRTTAIVFATGLYRKTRSAAVVPPAAEPPTQ